MKRKRISCSKLTMFGKVENPCHKILCDIVAEEVEQTGDEVIVKDLKEIRLKCNQCKSITKIVINHVA